MCPIAHAAATPVYRRVMIFIDGGYLREGFKRIYKHERINWPGLYVLLKTLAQEERRYPEVIRAYYYDAIVDPMENPDKFKKQKEYFSEIEEHGVYDVKLARLKKTEKRARQKGADVKLAVEMVTKAFQNHYDIAILLTGDDDFLDLVKTVKDLTDKRVYGAFYPDHISEDLWKSFDRKQPLTKQLLDKHGIAIE